MMTIDQQIQHIDRVRRETFSPVDGRPITKRSPRGQRQPLELVRAKGRLRTAAWRRQNESLKRPTAEAVGAAFLDALVSMDGANDLDRVRNELKLLDVIRDAYLILEAQGYARRQINDVMRRRRENILRDRGMFVPSP